MKVQKGDEKFIWYADGSSGNMLQLVLELWVKEKKEFLEKHLRRIIPANLMVEVKLNANTYGKLQVMTHGQMKELKWKYGQIGLEDLSIYE